GMELDAKTGRAGAGGGDRHDRHLVFQGEARRAGRRHCLMPEEGNGDALIELLIVHQRNGRALGEGAHQLPCADALGRVYGGAVIRALAWDALVEVWIVQGTGGHYRMGNALGDGGGHDFPIGEMAGYEDRALAAVADLVEHVEADNLDPAG